MDGIWERIEAEVSRRPDGARRVTMWLVERTGLTKQAIGHWKTRGVPPRVHQLVADALGWSVDQLLGKAPAEAWPFQYVPRRRFEALTPIQRGMVEQAMLDAIVKAENMAADAASWKRLGNGA